MNDWRDRKRAELLAKLDSLRGDIGSWCLQSQEGQRLEKHHSQIRRIDNQLSPVIDRLLSTVTSDDAIASWRKIEDALMDLLRVWGYFRDKISVRLVEDYAPYLLLADDFAWACYLPAQRAAVGSGFVGDDALREPPLVCLDEVASPFSLVRGSSYGAEVGTRTLTTAVSRQLVRQLPIPIISVPWFQISHLPDALIIGHEVAHHVLGDLGLSGELNRSLQSAAADHRMRPGWSDEIFCDLYGTLCVGRAFAVALGDFLRVLDEPPGDDPRYPPTSARLGVCLAVLEHAGQSTDAEALRHGWAADGQHVAEAEVEYGTGAAVEALLAAHLQTLGGKQMTEVIGFGPARERASQQEADELLQGRDTRTREVRVLLAAAGKAFAGAPEGYAAKQVSAAVLEAATRLRRPGVRWGGDQAAAGPGRAGRLSDDIFDLIMNRTAPDDRS